MRTKPRGAVARAECQRDRPRSSGRSLGAGGCTSCVRRRGRLIAPRINTIPGTSGSHRMRSRRSIVPAKAASKEIPSRPSVAVDATFETGLKSPLDDALMAHAAGHPLDGWHKLDERPFDFERRRVSVLAEAAGNRIEIVKGAPETVLGLCDLAEEVRRDHTARSSASGSNPCASRSPCGRGIAHAGRRLEEGGRTDKDRHGRRRRPHILGAVRTHRPAQGKRHRCRGRTGCGRCRHQGRLG